MRGFLVALALLSCAFAAAAEYVTQSEGAVVLNKTEETIKSVLQLKIMPPCAPGSGIMTREQLLDQFAKIITVTEPKFVFTPPTIRTVPGYMTFKEAKYRSLGDRLARMGFVDKVGPLLTAKVPGLTPQQFGDALGYFVSRLAEVTHLPSSKYSPYLMRPGG